MQGRRGPSGSLRLALDRQFGVARPLVPRAEVVPGVVAGGPERDDGEPGARARVAVRDHRAVVLADQRSDLLGGLGLARPREERGNLHVSRARDVPLAGIARIAALAGVLVVAPDVQDQRVAV